MLHPLFCKALKWGDYLQALCSCSKFLMKVTGETVSVSTKKKCSVSFFFLEESLVL